jgi:hypothetical protein
MSTLSSGDMDWLAALLLDVGTAEIMPRFRNLGDGAVQAEDLCRRSGHRG